MLKVKSPEIIKDEYCNSQDLKCCHLQSIYGDYDYCMHYFKHVNHKKGGSPINNRLLECVFDPMKSPEFDYEKT